ncbi:DgyrCDS5550 [Dimorphilus gyrociliatus]|uniref:DgyrCDS5550 n=1 Tax=Dimorphilus gyrociliatus TaxID=2664684 RepID=A0A7I8VLV2_9ANNE|nr:DgyrCDS5550 [Dimorphilus gyrociliatus]
MDYIKTPRLASQSRRKLMESDELAQNMSHLNNGFEMRESALEPIQHRSKKKKKKSKKRPSFSDTYTMDDVYNRRPSVASNGDSTVTPSDDVYSKNLERSRMDKQRLEEEDDTSSRKEEEKHSQFERDVSRFVRQYIKHKECDVYIKHKKFENVCQCNRPKAWHDKKGLREEEAGEKWNTDIHSREIKATCYGTVQFRGFGQEATAPAPYVRVANNCDMDIMWKLLHEHWGLKAPKLLISVTGGAKRFFMKPRLKNNFKRGLVNAATSTGAWIITGGTGAGVMKFVGEAVREYTMSSANLENSIVALGIATWGIVDNKEALESRSLNKGADDGCFPAEYNIEGLDYDKKGVSPIDHNHTHFILVDDGKVKSFGAEISLRCDLERHISLKIETGIARQQSVNVPVVLLVLEGGVNTLETAAVAIANKTPVVVIQGSGRAADFIAYAYRITKVPGKEDESNFPSTFNEELRKRASEMFDWGREICQQDIDDKIEQCIVNIKAIIDQRTLVTVFQLDDAESTKEIDQAILYALLKANKSHPQSQLNLALAWNRCDVARAEIFTMENSKRWQNLGLNDAMFTALMQDRSDFVQLFLDNGVDLRKFLTIFRLRELYDNILHSKPGAASADLLRNLLQTAQQKWGIGCCSPKELRDDLPELLQHVGEVFAILLKESKNLYNTDRYIVPKESKMNASQTFVVTDKSGVVENAERELFLWAVALNRRTLALLFWRIGRDHIGAALTAASILKSLSEEANKEEELDLSTDLMNHAAEWEARAVGTLNECYNRNKRYAHLVLVRELTDWGNSTVLSLADSAELMDLMGHSCCQTKLNRIWKGKMALYTSEWKIWLTLVFQFLIPFLIKFTNENSTSNKVSPETEEDDEQPSNKNFTTKLYSVNLLGSGHQNISLLNAIKYFNTAPVTKFWFHTLSYIIFLGFFSFFILTDLQPWTSAKRPSSYEFLIWGWAATLFLEEFRQVSIIITNRYLL